MKRIIISSVLIIAILFSFSGCGSKKNDGSDTLSEISKGEDVSTDISTDEMDLDFTDNDLSGEYDPKTVTTVSEKEDVVKITDGGSYLVSGKHTQIVVEASDTDKPQIILSNAEITCGNGPAIYIKEADKVFLTVASGTTNTLSDGSSYNSSYDNADAVIFSKSDLTLNGSGTLKINCNYKSGIASKDDLVLCDLTLNVTSIGCAVEGKDCVKATNVDININSSGDGIKSTNSEESDRGYVYLESGKYSITCENDGIQAQTALIIDNGEYSVTSGGGSSVSSSSGNSGWGMWGSSFSSGSTTTASAKAIKSATLIKINGGSFNIDSSDDAIHSNSDTEINSGTFTITSGDDGIHADDALIINNGTIKITKSYEGLEATAVTVTGGNIDVTASDDGINAAGGNDSSAMGGRPGQNSFQSGSNASINICGGYLLIDASGDGVDSNGSISMSGGVLLVSGPTNNSNGSFDYDSSATISGGTAILVGSSGMAQSFSSSSSQASFIYTLSSSQSGGRSVALCDSSGKVIASFLPSKQYTSIVISSPDLEVGKSYTLKIAGTVSGCDTNGYTSDGTVSSADSSYDLSLSSVSSSFGSSGGSGGGMQKPGSNRRY